MRNDGPISRVEADPELRAFPPEVQARILADARATHGAPSRQVPTPKPAPTPARVRSIFETDPPAQARSKARPTTLDRYPLRGLAPDPSPGVTEGGSWGMPDAMSQQLVDQRLRRIPQGLAAAPSLLDDQAEAVQDAMGSWLPMQLGQKGLADAQAAGAPPPLTRAIDYTQAPAPSRGLGRQALDAAKEGLGAYAGAVADNYGRSLDEWKNLATGNIPRVEEDVRGLGALGRGLLANETAGLVMAADPSNFIMPQGGGRLAQAGLGAASGLAQSVALGDPAGAPANMVMQGVMGGLTGGHAPLREAPRGPSPGGLTDATTRSLVERFPQREVDLDPPTAPAPVARPARPAPQGRPNTATPPDVIAAPGVHRPLDYQTDAGAINEKTWYHGTGAKGLTADALTPHATKVEGLFGQGIYLTDNPDIAGGYANSRGKRSKAPTVYEAGVNVGQVLDLEKPVPPAVARLFQQRAGRTAGVETPEIRKAVEDALAAPGATGDSVYRAWSDAVGEFSHHEQIPVSEIHDDFYDLTIGLRELGYDAYTHVGGKRTGRDPHQTLILLDPNDDVSQVGRKGQVTKFEPVTFGGGQRVPQGARAGSIINPLSWFEGRKKQPDAAPPAAPGGPEPLPTSEGKPRYSAMVSLSDLDLDPKAYQFKESDATGANQRLAGDPKWNSDLAGRIIVHQRKDGTMFVADGHQRVNLAKRLQAKGASIPQLEAIVLREVDGWTTPDVRRYASKVNIGQGSATPVEVARFLRDGGLSAHDKASMSRQGDNATGFRLGEPLSTLGDEAFLMVANEKIAPKNPMKNAEIGAAVARATSDHAQQLAILKEIASEPKKLPTDASEAAYLAREMVADGFASAHKSEQGALFDMQALKANSRTIAKVLRGLESAIGRDKRLGGMLTEKANAIESVGGNKLDAEANAGLRTEAERLQFALDTLATTQGPFRDALKAIAQEADRGQDLAQSVEQARGALHRALAQELVGSERPAGTGDRSGGVAEAAAPAAAPLPGQGGMFDLSAFEQPKPEPQAEAPAPQAEVTPPAAAPTPPAAGQASTRASLQGKINALEKKRAAYEAAGQREHAGEAGRQIQALRDQMGPEPEAKAPRVDPDHVVASDYYNFRRANLSPEESAIRQASLQRVVSKMDHDPHAKVSWRAETEAALAIPWKDIDDRLRRPLKRGEALTREEMVRFRIEEQALQDIIGQREAQAREALAQHDLARHRELEDLIDVAEAEFDRFNAFTMPSKSEKGRALNSLKRRFNGDWDASYWRGKLRKAEGRTLADVPQEGTRSATAEKKLNRSVAKGSAAKRELDDAIRQLEALGIQGHGIDANPGPRLRSEPPGLMATLFSRVRGLVKGERGEMDIEAITRWLEAKRRRPDADIPYPRVHANDAIQALWEKAQAASDRVAEAAGEVTEQIADAKTRPDSGWVIASNLRKSGLLTGLGTLEINTLSNPFNIALEATAKTAAVPVDFTLSLLTKRRSVLAPRPDIVLKSGYKAATQGSREFVQVLRHGMTADQMAKMEVPKESNSGNKALDWWINFGFRASAAPDRWAKVYAYESSTREQCRLMAKNEARANSPNAPLDSATGKRSVKAREEELFRLQQTEQADPTITAQAIYDAEVATFAQTTVLGEWARNQTINKHGPAGWAKDPVDFAVNMVAPYKGVPSAMATSLMEYAVLGNVIKGGVKISKGELGRMVREGMTQAEQKAIAMAAGRGATGLALLLAGMALGKHGWITPSYDTETKQLNESANRPSGALYVAGRWVPVGQIPGFNILALGADLRNLTVDPAKVALGAFKTITNNPMTQGIHDTAAALNNPEKEGSKLVSSMAGSFIPSAASDVAKAFGTPGAPDLSKEFPQNIKDGLKARTPDLVGTLTGGLLPGRSSLPKKQTALGDVVEGQSGLSTFNRLHGREAREDFDHEARELLRLGVEPPAPHKSIPVGRKSIPLTEPEQRQLWDMQGKLRRQRIAETMALPADKWNKAYKDEDLGAQQDLVKKAIQDADREALKVFRAGLGDTGTREDTAQAKKATRAELHQQMAPGAFQDLLKNPFARPTFAPETQRLAPNAIEKGNHTNFDVNTTIKPRLTSVTQPPVRPLEPGNIDTAHRPIAHNGDGSISTVRSISIGTDDGTYLIPTVIGGKVVSNRQAIAHFQRTHEHLGLFKNDAQADRYAEWLHEEQAQRYVQPQAAPTLARPRL